MNKLTAGILTAAAMLAVSETGWGQKNLTWQSTSSTAWDTASNWYDEGLGGTSSTAPAYTDDVTINNSRGASVSPTVTSAGKACRSLVVGNGFVLTFNGYGTALVVGDTSAGNYDITIQNGGKICLNDSSFLTLAKSASDVFRIDNGGEYLHNTRPWFTNVFPAAACNFDPNSTVELGQNSVTRLEIAGYTFGNLKLSATNAKTYSSVGTTGTLTVNGTLELSSANVSYSPRAPAYKFKAITVSGGTFTLPSNAPVELSGDIANSGSIVLNNGVGFTFVGQSTISGNSITFKYPFTIPDSGAVVLSANIVANWGSSIYGTIDGVLDLGTSQISGTGPCCLNGKLIFRSLASPDAYQGNVQSTILILSPQAIFEFAGDGAQYMGSRTPPKLYINNGHGVNLTGDVQVIDTLTFVSGNLVLGNHNLTLNRTVTGASSGKCVVTNGTGSVAKSLDASTSFVFPASPDTFSYNPATITLGASSVTDSFFVRVGKGMSPGAPDSTTVVHRTWVITEKDAGGSAAQLTFQWAAAEEGATFTRNSSSIWRHDGSNWGKLDASAPGGSDPYTVTSIATDISSFSPFIIGNAGGLPVQLSSFRATVNGMDATLVWTTASETNTFGFEIERCIIAGGWECIGFVQGQGTSASSHAYSFVDDSLAPGRYSYRLRQIDRNGEFKYYGNAEVDIVGPKEYALKANFPNPFNPSTTIRFELPVVGRVTLKVYDLLGREVVSLVNDRRAPGTYTVKWDASSLPSGVYFYRLQSGSFADTKKLVLLK